jgi:hypothetical protein
LVGVVGAAGEAGDKRTKQRASFGAFFLAVLLLVVVITIFVEVEVVARAFILAVLLLEKFLLRTGRRIFCRAARSSPATC